MMFRGYLIDDIGAVADHKGGRRCYEKSTDIDKQREMDIEYGGQKTGKYGRD